MSSHSDTNTYEVYFLITIIVLLLGAIFFLFSYTPKVNKGVNEGYTQGMCENMGEIRHKINQFEIWSALPGKTIGQDVTNLDLLQLPYGCGVLYENPCETVEDCQKKIRKAISICWGYIQREPETTGTCLLKLQIKEGIVGEDLCKATVCEAGQTCKDTEAPNEIIKYQKCPQGGDTVSMEYVRSAGLVYGFDDKTTIEVYCTGTCSAANPA